MVFDALQAAKARKVDYVIVDTAGRLHTKTNLMAELEKMRRTAAKVIPSAPHEVLLVLDATTGQNGLEQARKFTESSGVTGMVLTKLDGTAKGGMVVAIARELNLPIRYIGVGEQAGDLLPFEPDKFIASLFGCLRPRQCEFRSWTKRWSLRARGLGRTSPNPAVGAVLVKDGEDRGPRVSIPMRRPNTRKSWRWNRRATRRAGQRFTSRWSHAPIRAARRLAPTLWCKPAWRT